MRIWRDDLVCYGKLWSQAVGWYHIGNVTDLIEFRAGICIQLEHGEWVVAGVQVASR